VPEGVAFEVDHFAWIDDRLEVSGRWYGLRGHRFVRPALTVEVDDDGDDRRRMLADLEHKPWAADDGTDWIAAFPWDGEPVELARAELAVAPTLAVDLPLPRLPRGHKRGSSGKRQRPTATTKAAPPREPATPVPEPDGATGERDALAGEREALARERDEAVRERDSLARERDEAAADHDKLARERDEAVAKRDPLARERDEAVDDRAALARERDAAVRARAAAVAERDEARRSLAAAIAERDRSEEARAAVLRERDVPDDRGLPPAAPRPLPQQSALALWGQRLTAVVALGVLAFVVYTLLEGVV
jgi:hypothetical protein